MVFRPSFAAFSGFSPLLSRVCLCAATLLVSGVAAVHAQDAVQVQPDVDNSKFQFAGVVNSPTLFVRSGPGQAYYATTKLQKGATVTVVGIKYEWLKILPPEGSFCFVSKLYVERRGDGSIGRVTKPEINVRAGSTVNSELKTTVQTKLNVGDDVKILGEQDEYYKIAPPPGAYLYVEKQFVDPVRALTPAVDPATPATPETPKASGGGIAATPAPAPAPGNDVAVAPTTRAADPVVAIAPTTLPSTPPVAQGPSPAQIESAEIDFRSLESDFTAAGQQPLDQQPAHELATRYETIAKNTALPDPMRRTANFRLAVLKVRVDAQHRLEEVRKMEADAAAHAVVLKAENGELQERLDANKVDVYTAVGTLQPSSLQFGADTLYRLTDPATGRTVIYLRGSTPDTVKFIGQFVGVRGEPVTDQRLSLKVIPYTEMTVVDASQVNGKISASIVPPSLIAHAISASTGNQ